MVTTIAQRQMVTAAMIQQVRPGVLPGIHIPYTIDLCEAFCHFKFGSDKQRLNECLDDCKAAKGLAAVAERLQRELFDSFIDYVWGGGDIDPVPFEEAVRARFSRRTSS